MVSVATGMANYYENSLQRPLFVFAMKIDSAAVSGRRGGFQTRPTPVPWDATAIFLLLCDLRKAIVIPVLACADERLGRDHICLSRGSRRSRSQSPRKLRDITTRKMASPGKKLTHQAVAT